MLASAPAVARDPGAPAEPSGAADASRSWIAGAGALQSRTFLSSMCMPASAFSCLTGTFVIDCAVCRCCIHPRSTDDTDTWLDVLELALTALGVPNRIVTRGAAVRAHRLLKPPYVLWPAWSAACRGVPPAMRPPLLVAAAAAIGRRVQFCRGRVLPLPRAALSANAPKYRRSAGRERSGSPFWRACATWQWRRCTSTTAAERTPRGRWRWTPSLGHPITYS